MTMKRVTVLNSVSSEIKSDEQQDYENRDKDGGDEGRNDCDGHRND